MADDLHVGTSIFRIPYLRLLSDLLPGVAALTAVGYHLAPGRMPDGWVTPWLTAINRNGMATLVVAATAGLLALGVGILVNGLSWFILGGAQVRLEQWQARRSQRAPSVRLAGFDDSFVAPSGWYLTTGILRRWLAAHHPGVLEQFAPQAGASRLARALSFVVLADMVVRIAMTSLAGPPRAASFFTLVTEMLLAVFLLVLAALLSWHYHLMLLGTARYSGWKQLPWEVQELLWEAQRAETEPPGE